MPKQFASKLSCLSFWPETRSGKDNLHANANHQRSQPQPRSGTECVMFFCAFQSSGRWMCWFLEARELLIYWYVYIYIHNIYWVSESRSIDCVFSFQGIVLLCPEWFGAWAGEDSAISLPKNSLLQLIDPLLTTASVSKWSENRRCIPLVEWEAST